MKVLLLLPLALLGTPVLAGTFIPPEGCTATRTVQGRGCYVSNFYTCSADAPGDQWRVDYDQEGMFFRSRIDFETQWVESYDLNPTVKQTLDPNPPDPASFSELLATGTDTFTFSLTKETGEHSTVTGFDKLTGRSKVIDGIPLQETEFQFTETDDAGNVLRNARGHEYIHADWRTFFSGTSEWDQGDGTWLPLEGAPVSFALPGEPGFGATQPIYECDDIMSDARAPDLLPTPAALTVAP
jgi:hypothetical protein